MRMMMRTMKTTTTPKETAEKYIETRNHYFTNAKELIVKGELRKASEMLWGAVTQTIKALAALKGKKIVNHEQFYAYMERLSKELNDPSLFVTFTELNTLHRNFYDEFIP